MSDTPAQSTEKSAPEVRQEMILQLVTSRGFVSTEALAKLFNVTTQTIRADINRLSGDGRLRRYHGGAGLMSTLDNATFSHRRAVVPEEKKQIATAVGRRIPNSASIFLHYGTTMEAVAHALQDHRNLLVLTNNISAVSFLSDGRDSRAMLAGGEVNVKERCTQGTVTTEFLRRFHVDFGLLSVGCVGSDGTLFEYDHDLSSSARAIIEQSRRVFLAVDDGKFEREGLTRVGHVSEATTLFTNRAPVKDMIALLEEHKVELVVTDGRAGSR